MDVKKITLALACSILSSCVQLSPANIDRILDRIDKEFESGQVPRPVTFTERPSPKLPNAHFSGPDQAPSATASPTHAPSENPNHSD